MKTLAILLGVTLCLPVFAGKRPKHYKNGSDLLRRSGRHKRAKVYKNGTDLIRRSAEQGGHWAKK